ncbi:MAG: NnrS family protein [Deltaproteobacteria bacterium]|nr:MAG: NnrS family protein [Deltaproteobacteria bacterium]
MVTPRVLFALGFRPFFLAAGLAAVALMAVWIAILQGGVAAPAYFDRAGGSAGWHSHEMLFGYLTAVVAGFLLTAVRNWTGLPTPTGGALAALVGLWFVGRVTPFVVGDAAAGAVAALDLAFLPALTIAVAIPLLRSGQRRNLVFLLVLAALALANLLIHLEALGLATGSAWIGTRLAVDGIVLLIAIIAGRVVPFFTRGALPGAQPRSWPILDGLALASIVALAALRPATPELIPVPLFCGVAALAALCHAVRLAAWYDARIWSQPLLWVLFVGYAWLVVGFALTALSTRLPLAPLLGLHAFTAGGMGTVTLGMMARIALGHTGRPFVPPRAVVVAFALVPLAAVVRVLVPLFAPHGYARLLVLAGTLWLVAFLLFVVAYAPILLRPRADGRPG